MLFALAVSHIDFMHETNEGIISELYDNTTVVTVGEAAGRCAAFA